MSAIFFSGLRLALAMHAWILQKRGSLKPATDDELMQGGN
jgi:hypothetical protein